MDSAPVRADDGSKNWLPALAAGASAAAGGIALLTYEFSGNLFIAGGALACGAGAIAVFLRDMASSALVRRDKLVEACIELSTTGELPARLIPSELAELAPVGAAINQMADLKQQSTDRISALTASLSELPSEIAGALAEVNRAAEEQEEAVEETSSLLANINTSIKGINAEVMQLARSNEETASSVLEMGCAIEQVATSASALRDGVESSTTSVHELNAQIRRVAESGDSVQQAAEETASSIAQMDHTIREVGEHVGGASKLTEQVSQSADEGARAVGATIEGIAQIKTETSEAKTALEGLADRIGAIGEIASVINGISDETNLLSLNAAIIAAQAGEHGKAFAVVAEQVKTLARRTTASTKEIESLIGSVEQQSATAVKAMAAGIDAVDAGVTRSRAAGDSLERIRESARDASGRVAEISRAAQEQGRTSAHVAESAQRTFELVQQISAALTEQSGATEQLLRNSTESLEISRQMSSATDEQRASSRYISENISSITGLIGSIQLKTATHETSSTGVAESVMSILENARKGSERIPEVARAVVRMRDQAEAVRAELVGFATGDVSPEAAGDGAHESA